MPCWKPSRSGRVGRSTPAIRDACYPLVFFDAIWVKIRDEGFVRNKPVLEPVEGAVYIAPGILPDGTKDILGIGIEQTEGETFWLGVMNELNNRGHFPGDEAAMTLPYLVLDHAAAQWIRPPREWCEAETQFAIIFGDRVMV